MTISLRHYISALALSTALVMGACSPKDKAGSPQISAEKAPLGLAAPSDEVFARHFAIEKRNVDNAEADKALAALGLAESGTGDLSWADRKGSNGNYIYTNLFSKTDDGMITIAKAEVFGVRMEDELATFDRVDFNGLTITSEDVNMEARAMSIARPTPDTAKAIIKSLEEFSDDDNIRVDIDDSEDFGFGAISVSDLTVTGKEVNGTIDQMVYGSDEETALMDFKVSDIDLTIQERPDDIASVFTLKSLSGTGFRTDDMKTSTMLRGAQPSLGKLLGKLNLYEKPYDSIVLDSLNFDNPNISVNLPGFEGQAKTKGDVTTITQVSKPLVVELKEAPKDRQMRQAYDTLQSLGFDRLEFTSSQTSVLDKGSDTVRVKDGLVEMKDGFRLNYTYGASGLTAMQEAMNTGTSERAQQKMAMEVLNFDDLKISLEDQSIVERGLKLAAQMRGADPDRVKKEMRVAVTMAPLMARTDIEKELASELGGAFMDFIENGGTLTIEMDPIAPVSVAELMELGNSGKSLKSYGFSARQDN